MPPPSRSRSTGRRAILVWFVTLFAASQLPLYLVRYVGIQDFANHLARLHVYVNLDRDPTLQHYYARAVSFAPNLAMEVVVPPVAALVGVEIALKVFISLATFLLASGAAALSVALTGQLAWMALAGLLFASSFVLHWGLLNYLFGLGAALWLLAAWIGTAPQRTPARIAAFGVGATLVYACHLSAFGVYIIAAAVHEVTRPTGPADARGAARLRRLAPVALQTLPALILQTLAYRPNLAPELDLVGRVPLLHLAAYKLRLLGRGLPMLLAPDLLVGTAFLAAGAALLSYGVRTGRLAVAASSRNIAAALVLVALLIPPTGFGSALLDARLLLPATLIFCAGIALTDGSRGLQRVTLWAIVVGIAASAAATLGPWRRASDQVARLRAAMQSIEAGSTLATVEPVAGGAMPGHAAGWAVVDRSVFLSSLYARPFNPVWIAYRTEYVPLADLARLDRPKTEAPDIERLLDRFDYLVVLGSAADTAHRESDARTIAAAEGFRIVRGRGASRR